MLTYGGCCLLGLCAMVFVFIRTGSSTEQMNLAALLRSLSSGYMKDLQARGESNKLLENVKVGALGPKVLTKDGSIQGMMVDECYIFYGIPFADPPVATSRWKPPRRVTPWQGVYDATYPRAACMQACVGPLSDECPQKVGRLRFL